MKIKANKTIMDKNGYTVFTKDHSYDIYMDKGDILAVYCDLAAMYNLKKEELNNFEIQ